MKKESEIIIEPDELFSLKKSIVEVLTCIWLSTCKKKEELINIEAFEMKLKEEI